MGTIDKLVRSIEKKSYGDYVIEIGDIPSPSAIIAKANEDISIGSKYSFLNGSTNMTTWADDVSPLNQPIDADTEFYAVVKVNTYNVTFEWNKFGREDEPQTVEYGNSPTLPDTSWIEPNTGFRFEGWTVNGVDVVNFPYPIYEDTDFTAKWQNVNTVDVYFVVKEDDAPNYGWLIKMDTYEIGHVITANEVPTKAEIENAVDSGTTTNGQHLDYGKEGFDIGDERWIEAVGYEVVATSSGKKYFYTYISRKMVCLHFDENNGTGTVRDSCCGYALDLVVPDAPTYAHHEFKWWENDEDPSITYNAGAVYNNAREVEYYTAVWSMDTVTVKFYVGGANVSSQTIAYGGHATPPSVTVDEGEMFTGTWIRRNCNSGCEWDGNRFSNEGITDSLVEFDAEIVSKITVKWVGIDEDGTDDNQIAPYTELPGCVITLEFYGPRALQQNDVPTLADMVELLSDATPFSDMIGTGNISWAIKIGDNRYDVIDPLSQGVISQNITFYGLFARNYYEVDWMKCNGVMKAPELVPHGSIPIYINWFASNVGCDIAEWQPSAATPITGDMTYYPLCDCRIKINVVNSVNTNYGIRASISKLSVTYLDGHTEVLDISISLGENITANGEGNNKHIVNFSTRHLPIMWSSFSLAEATAILKESEEVPLQAYNTSAYNRSQMFDNDHMTIEPEYYFTIKFRRIT